jgi:hypothetical protein
MTVSDFKSRANSKPFPYRRKSSKRNRSQFEPIRSQKPLIAIGSSSPFANCGCPPISAKNYCKSLLQTCHHLFLNHTPIISTYFVISYRYLVSENSHCSLFLHWCHFFFCSIFGVLFLHVMTIQSFPICKSICIGAIFCASVTANGYCKWLQQTCQYHFLLTFVPY